MTRQELARELTMAEGGAKQVNIAQMHEVLKVLSKRMKGPSCASILKALLASLLLVTVTGCGTLPAEFTERLDVIVKDIGAGNMSLSCAVEKDGKQLGSIRGDLACTDDTLQLTGCHAKGLQFSGPK